MTARSLSTRSTGPDTGRRSPQTAEDFVHTLETLLDLQRFAAARQLAARAAAKFPQHPWLAKTDRVLNSKKVTSRPASGPARTKEFDWLRRNSGAYRGKWVALSGDRLIVSSDSAAEVVREIRSRDLEAPPLVHRVE